MSATKSKGFGLFKEVVLFLLTIVYVAGPVDLVPDFLPAGWLDDGLVALIEGARLVQLYCGKKGGGFFSALSRTVMVIAILAAIGVVALIVGIVALIVHLCQ